MIKEFRTKTQGICIACFRFRCICRDLYQGFNFTESKLGK